MGENERRITGQCSAADIKAMLAFLKVGGKLGEDVKPKHAVAAVVIAKFSRTRIPMSVLADVAQVIVWKVPGKEHDQLELKWKKIPQQRLDCNLLWVEQMNEKEKGLASAAWSRPSIGAEIDL